MARSLTTQDVTWFLDHYDKGQLDLNPPYQRRSVWSQRDKRFFIDTVLNNHPAPPIFLHKTLDSNGRATYHVVDGKQRLQTIIDFRQNKIRIPDDFANINLQKKRFKDLEGETKELFWNYVLIVEMLPDISDAAIRNTFERINRNSRKLTSQELRHAKYDGWFISYVEGEAEKAAEWKDFGVVTAGRTKRMADVQFISELCAVVIKGNILGFDQDALDELYAEYDETSEIGNFVEEDFEAEMDRLKTIIAELLRLKPEIKNYLKAQSNLYSLWSYLHLEKSRYSDVSTFAEKYSNFMSSVSTALDDGSQVSTEDESDQITPQQAIRSYAFYTRGASTDLSPRRKRHRALVTAIHGA
jgi:hypothetical protein